MSRKVIGLRIVEQGDQDPDLSYLEDENRYKGVPAKQAAKYRQQDQDRLASYGNSWSMVGVYMEADVDIDGVIQKIRTPGLWGVESDSDAKYIRQIVTEEYSQLKDILRKIGVRSVPALTTAKEVSR